jgi:hypothetical protein
MIILSLSYHILIQLLIISCLYPIMCIKRTLKIYTIYLNLTLTNRIKCNYSRLYVYKTMWPQHGILNYMLQYFHYFYQIYFQIFHTLPIIYWSIWKNIRNNNGLMFQNYRKWKCTLQFVIACIVFNYNFKKYFRD